MTMTTTKANRLREIARSKSNTLRYTAGVDSRRNEMYNLDFALGEIRSKRTWSRTVVVTTTKTNN